MTVDDYLKVTDKKESSKKKKKNSFTDFENQRHYTKEEMEELEKKLLAN